MCLWLSARSPMDALCRGPYVTDLVLGLLQSLHLRSVDHHAETFPFVLLKVPLVKSLQCTVHCHVRQIEIPKQICSHTVVADVLLVF